MTREAVERAIAAAESVYDAAGISILAEAKDAIRAALVTPPVAGDADEAILATMLASTYADAVSGKVRCKVDCFKTRLRQEGYTIATLPAGDVPTDAVERLHYEAISAARRDQAAFDSPDAALRGRFEDEYVATDKAFRAALAALTVAVK